MVDIVMAFLDVVCIVGVFGAVYLAYQLTRMIGGFRAWWLLIIAFTVYNVRVLEFLLADLMLIPKIDWIGHGLRCAFGLLLLIAMYDLRRTFRRQLEAEAAPSHIQKRLGAIAVPAFAITIISLGSLGIEALFNPPLLCSILCTVFVGGTSFVVAFLSARSYLISGSVTLLLQGAAVLAFGFAFLLGVWVPGGLGGSNVFMTVHSIGALLGGALHALSVIVARSATRMISRFRELGMSLSYFGVLVFITFIAIASFQAAIPTFFIDGVGSTPLQRVVLGTAIALFAFSSILYMRQYSESKSEIVYWYSLALALIALGLFSWLLARNSASPVMWAGRFAIYLGGAYFLVSVRAAFRRIRAGNMNDQLSGGEWTQHRRYNRRPWQDFASLKKKARVYVHSHFD